MKTFRDKTGREWTVVLNVAAVKRIRSLVGVDLLQIVSDEGLLLARLTEDPVLLADLLYVVCRAECTASNISDEAFGEALGGNALAEATDAFLGELADFFPGRRGELLKRVLAKVNGYMDEALDLAEARLEDPALNDRIRRLIRGESSTDAPASSDSPPTH